MCAHIKLTEQARSCVTTADEAVTSEKWLWKRSVEVSGERRRGRLKWRVNERERKRERERDQPCTNEFSYLLEYSINDWHWRVAMHTYSLRYTYAHVLFVTHFLISSQEQCTSLHSVTVWIHEGSTVTHKHGCYWDIRRERGSQVSYSSRSGTLCTSRRDSCGQPCGNNWRQTAKDCISFKYICEIHFWGI